MSFILSDRVKETTTTTGTGSLSLGGAVIGFEAFSDRMVDGDTTHYSITDDTDWEVGVGTYEVTGNLLIRTTVLKSSNADAAVNWGAGTKTVFMTVSSAKVDEKIDGSGVDKVTVSPTAPSSPNAGDIWIDSDEFQTLPSSNSFVTGETPTGTVNGVNLEYITASNYIPGSLRVYVNGLNYKPSTHFTETTPASGIFTMNEAPLTGGVITVDYQVAADPYSGNADTLDGVHLSAIFSAIYPVGAIFISGSSTMPALISAIGTWARIEGKFIVGASDSDGDFDVNDTGGAKTHNHEIPLQSGYDTGRAYPYNSSTFQSYATAVGADIYSKVVSSQSRQALGVSNTSANIEVWKMRTADISNLPPFKAKYMWERTA